jgi:solute carrier family 50 (sugar transporter)
MPSFFITQVAPALGVILSTIQYSASILTVLECRQKQDLGNLNPIPIAVNFINSIAWIVYGCMLKNPYLIASVTGGSLSSLFSLSTSFYLLGKHQHFQTMESVERILFGGLLLWILIAFLLGTIAATDERMSLTIVGFIACVVTVCYYYSPLSTIRMVIRTKNSSSLHFPMLVMNFIGSSIWTVYGLYAIYDPFLFIPCGLGVFFTSILLMTKVYYRQSSGSNLAKKEDKVTVTLLANGVIPVWDRSPLHPSPHDIQVAIGDYDQDISSHSSLSTSLPFPLIQKLNLDFFQLPSVEAHAQESKREKEKEEEGVPVVGDEESCSGESYSAVELV